MSHHRFITAIIIILISFSLFVTAASPLAVDEQARSINSGPDPPEDPSPEDGEEGVNATPELSVLVTHPDDRSMDVSFYDYSAGTLIDTVQDVPSGERAEVTWDGLSTEENYSWYVEVDDGEERSSGGPWEFSTAGVDYIRITDEIDGEVLEGGKVPTGYIEYGYLSTYNDSSGFIGNFQGGWEAGGNAELRRGELDSFNGIEIGDSDGKAWFNVSYGEDHHFSVNYEVEEAEIDRIEIRTESSGGGSTIEEMTLELEDTMEIYAASYNRTVGFLRDVEADWTIDSEEVGEIDEDHGTSTTFKAEETGYCNVTAQYEDFEHVARFEVFYDGDPLILGDIPDLELEKDFGIHEVNLTEHADDEYDDLTEMKWYLTGYDPSVIEVLGENQTGNHELTLLSEENSFGSMKVRYHLVNSGGNEVSQDSWINVTTEYQSPEFKLLPDLKVHYEEPYEFDYSPYIEYDSESMDELQLETDDPEHTEVDGLEVTYEYPESMLGEEVLVVLTVSDGQESDISAITVEVTSNKPPEEEQELPDLEIKQGEKKENVFDLDDYFMDPEDDPLYMSYGYTYLSITIHGDNTVDVEADVDWHGVETVTFRAEDPEGGIAEQTIEVTVIPVNYPPEIKELPDFVVHYDEPYVFDLEFYISDRDNETHELEISTDSPEFVTVDGTNLIMLYPEEMEGETVALEVFVSDGIDTTSEVTTVTVGDVYPPEQILPLHDVAFKQNEKLINAFRLDNHFRDRQNDTMYYSSGNENIEVVIHENSSVDFHAKENWYGQELITIRATNSAGALVEDSITVTVLPVNQPPKIADIPIQEGVAGRNWIFDISEFISDVDNETHELDVTVQDPNVHVVGHKLIFDYDSPGEYVVTVEVCDGLDNSTSEIEVIVHEREEPLFFEGWSLLALGFIPIALVGTIFYFKKGEFTIEDIFLIHDSGVLIKHKTRTLKAERDEEILAGMFTAVNNFVGDAFGGEEKHTLKRMEYGDDKVLVHKGEYVILAVFISGDDPSNAMESLSALVEDIEEKYGDELEDWDGSHEDLSGIGDLIDEFLDKKMSYKKSNGG